MPELATLQASLQQYSDDAKADNTKLAYAKQWHQFEAWCVTKALSSLPAVPETVALFLAACADAELSVSTLEQAKAAITFHHDEAGEASPCATPLVKKAWQGIRRRLGAAPNQKHPLDAEQLRAMYEALPAGPLDVRDRAMIGLGFSGAFRRGELVGLDVDDLSFVRRGLEARVRAARQIKKIEGSPRSSRGPPTLRPAPYAPCAIGSRSRTLRTARYFEEWIATAT